MFVQNICTDLYQNWLHYEIIICKSSPNHILEYKKLIFFVIKIVCLIRLLHMSTIISLYCIFSWAFINLLYSVLKNKKIWKSSWLKKHFFSSLNKNQKDELFIPDSEYEIRDKKMWNRIFEFG